MIKSSIGGTILTRVKLALVSEMFSVKRSKCLSECRISETISVQLPLLIIGDLAQAIWSGFGKFSVATVRGKC